MNTCAHCLHFTLPHHCDHYGSTRPDQPCTECPSWAARPAGWVDQANVIAADAPAFRSIGEGKTRDRLPLARCRREPARRRLQ